MSSSRRVLCPYAVYSGALTTTSYSEETDVQGLDVLQYDVMWTSGSSPNIEIVVESLAKKPDENPLNWVWEPLTFQATPTISGTSGNHQIVLGRVPFSRCRLKFAVTSGSATVVATIKGKGV